MPRWHHSDSSSERYQEVKSIKTFYAAHISRSQAKSMFGNWTISHCYILNIKAVGLVVSEKIFLVFPIVSLWELSVAMETTILVQSDPKPNAVNPPTQ